MIWILLHSIFDKHGIQAPIVYNTSKIAIVLSDDGDDDDGWPK
jgi:hypothetical protein